MTDVKEIISRGEQREYDRYKGKLDANITGAYRIPFNHIENMKEDIKA